MIKKSDFYSAPDYFVFAGPTEATPGGFKWAVFDLDGNDLPDLDAATARVGFEVYSSQPELDLEFADENDGFDDYDAALAFLASGGMLVKVPDHDGSPHWRLYVASTGFNDPIKGTTP
jgi:hypothetical protein